MSSFKFYQFTQQKNVFMTKNKVPQFELEKKNSFHNQNSKKNKKRFHSFTHIYMKSNV